MMKEVMAVQWTYLKSWMRLLPRSRRQRLRSAANGSGSLLVEGNIRGNRQQLIVVESKLLETPRGLRYESVMSVGCFTDGTCLVEYEQ
jgi:hypothetical protein